MAYLNEFPHCDSNGRNLDWLLEQYSTFEKRLQDIMDEFHETVQTLKSDIQGLEDSYQRQLDLFESRILSEVREMTEKVDSINEHTEQYVNNYLEENITEILQTNPTLEVKFEKIGYIDTNETCTLELETDKIYEIMTIDYALNMHKGLAVNNACKVTQCPLYSGEFVADVSLIGSGEPLDPYALDVNKGYALSDETSVSLSASSNVLTVTNNGTNRVRVYAKIIGEL